MQPTLVDGIGHIVGSYFWHNVRKAFKHQPQFSAGLVRDIDELLKNKT